MKVLGISAGTKNGSNDAMCKEALMGAKEQGADIEFINVWDLDLKHCTGCVACVKSLMSGRGGKCVLKDDFDWLKGEMLDADGIVFAGPIFESGMAGIFHTIVDRFGPRTDRAMNIIGTQIAEESGGTPPDPRILKDKVISFMAIGGSDWATRAQCDAGMLAMTPAWKVIDNEVFMWSKCIVMEDDKVARAHEIGVNIANAAADIEKATYQGDPGVCPHCHCREIYIADDAKKCICTLCGLEGEIAVANGKVTFTFDPADEHKAHDTVSGKFLHADDIKENEGKLDEWRKSDEFKARKQKYFDFISSTRPDDKKNNPIDKIPGISE